MNENGESGVKVSGESAGRGRLDGIDRIRTYLNSLDHSPGVYRMLGEKGEVLYVGKARSLLNRVKSYTNPSGHSARVAKMIDLTRSMMFLTTRTETEALLLEQNLIKQLKPRFNVLLRDDKSFPNILVSRSHRFPQIKKHRGSRKEKGVYYGPFASASAVNRTLNQLQKVFLLRNCSDAMFESRTKPCLLYQIKRCCAPCVGRVSEEQYAQLVQDAELFLSGRTSKVQRQLAEQMEAASNALEFERAAAVRDRIHALTQVQSVQGVNPRNVPEADIVGLHMEGLHACVQVFFIRASQNWGNHAYFPRTGAGAGSEEVLEAFLGQFYRSKRPPRQIFLSHPIGDLDLMQSMLSDKRGGRVQLLFPTRGAKAVLVENAVRNARESLARKLSETATQKKLLAGLAAALQINESLTRVEVFDNSHVHGSDAVGAMIVVGPEGFLKSSYRKYNFRSEDLAPGDDFAMMREMLSRRFRRMMKDDPNRESGKWPDLIVVDGGAGQLSAAVETLENLGISGLPLIAVAKGVDRNLGREEFHSSERGRFALQSNDPVLYFVQRIRDEAHRFAIGAHRSKRRKSVSSSSLSGIEGVGGIRKAALLSHFGSTKAVGKAGLEDLKAVSGISDSLAEAIYGHFREQG